MATRLDAKGVQAIGGIVAGALMVCAASSALAMDMGPQAYTSAPALKMESPYKSRITPFVSPGGAPGGFGLFASSGHHTVNLSQPTSWAVNPDASASGAAVGLGWRARNLSATMGYVKPPSGASNEAFSGNDGVQHFRPRSMVGFGLSLRY